MIPTRPLNSSECTQLDEVGFVILRQVLAGDSLERVRRRIDALFEAEGEHAGREFKQEAGCQRLANLVTKGDEFHPLLNHPAVMPHVAHVLGADLKLSSMNARAALPGESLSQPLHADMGAITDQIGYWVCNTVWMLDPFTTTNGALRAVPGSHRLGRLPQDVMADPTVPHPEEIVITGDPGDVVVMNAHLWHGGLANRSAARRTAVHVFYCRRDKPQQQYQRELVENHVQEKIAPELRWLLALDDPTNDALSQQVDQRSGFLK